MPQASGDVELTPLEVVRDLEPEDRLAVVRTRAVELVGKCPNHVPRSEHGYPVAPSGCHCVPERGFRVGMIRRLMEDHYWLPDGQPYDVVLAEVFGLAPATIRNDASVAAMHLRNSEDPEAAEQRKRDGTNRTEDWAHEAWAMGDRRAAVALNEQALKASKAIAGPGTTVNIANNIELAVNALVKPDGSLRPEAPPVIRQMGSEAAREVMVGLLRRLEARLPEAERAAFSDSFWEDAHATFVEMRAFKQAAALEAARKQGGAT